MKKVVLKYSYALSDSVFVDIGKSQNLSIGVACIEATEAVASVKKIKKNKIKIKKRNF